MEYCESPVNLCYTYCALCCCFAESGVGGVNFRAKRRFQGTVFRKTGKGSYKELFLTRAAGSDIISLENQGISNVSSINISEERAIEMDISLYLVRK